MTNGIIIKEILNVQQLTSAQSNKIKNKKELMEKSKRQIIEKGLICSNFK